MLVEVSQTITILHQMCLVLALPLLEILFPCLTAPQIKT